MKKIGLVSSVLLMMVILINCASNPQKVYERVNGTITEKDVVSANIINAKYLQSKNIEQVKYIMMHIVKYKMKFPQVNYCCVKNELEKLEQKGKTYQIRLMAYITKNCLNDSVKITNKEELIKIKNTDLFYVNIYNEINKKSKNFVYEELNKDKK